MFCVLKEIEGQRNLRVFNAIAPEIHKKVTRTSSVSWMNNPSPSKCYKLGRQTSDPSGHKRRRILSAPSPTVANNTLQFDRRLTPAAQKLSKEEMALLEKDILQPLDVYSILRQVRVQTLSKEELVQWTYLAPLAYLLVTYCISELNNRITSMKYWKKKFSTINFKEPCSLLFKFFVLS